MGFLKLVTNRIGLEWKKAFNHNADETEREISRLDQKDKYLEARFSNTVLKAGGNSPNEVIDSRVNWRGDTFLTLQDRLIAGEELSDQERQELAIKIKQQTEELRQLQQAVAEIHGDGGTVDIYVSTNGSDTTGNGTEEKPFQTIQTAINSLALVGSRAITIWVDDGVYLEDVYIRSLSTNTLTIRSIQNIDTMTPATSDLPVKVRSIGFYYCSGYFQVAGIQFVDQANTPSFSASRYALLCEQGGYLAVNTCKFADNTLSMINHRSTYVGGISKMNTYGCHFVNQNCLGYSVLMAEMRAGGSNSGQGNNIGFISDSATVRDGTNAQIGATTRRQVAGQGLIIVGGQILT